MKFLHTSDWHLGVSMEQAPRLEEHRLFLDWLLEQIRVREIDALIVAGDIFHYTQPSAAAQRELFGFLARCATLTRETSLSTVLLVAGNHDSPSRFDAPREILQALDVHVVGAMDDTDRCLVPIRGASGEVEAVIAGVPYLSESRLGVITTDRSPAQVRDEYQTAFAELYGGLAEQASGLHPGVPLVATGHLTVAASGQTVRLEDFHTPLHQFHSFGALEPTIFDPRFAYVALGHIHRHHRVGDSQAWYAGSPVPTDVVDARSPRYVVEVETSVDAPGEARVRRVPVPRWRDVYELRGDADEIAKLLEGLTWESPLPPYLHLELELDTPTRAGVRPFQDLLTARFDEPRPRIVAFKKTLKGEDPLELEAASREERLDELSPEDVFAKMYRLKHSQAPPAELLVAFRSLLTDDADASAQHQSLEDEA